MGPYLLLLNSQIFVFLSSVHVAREMLFCFLVFFPMLIAKCNSKNVRNVKRKTPKFVEQEEDGILPSEQSVSHHAPHTVDLIAV